MSKSDPYCKLYKKYSADSSWVDIGKTEVIDNQLNPDFCTTFTLNYYFEKEQIIKFEMHDHDDGIKDDFIGRCETTIGKIVGSKNQTFIGDL
jgi:Ca2+-dependent lipid-binding protein